MSKAESEIGVRHCGRAPLVLICFEPSSPLCGDHMLFTDSSLVTRTWQIQIRKQGSEDLWRRLSNDKDV